MSDNRNRPKIDPLAYGPSLINRGDSNAWLFGMDMASKPDVTAIRELRTGVYGYARNYLEDMNYTRDMVYQAFGIPSELITKNDMKVDYPIGAEVYVKDNSYAKNLATGKNDNLANRGNTFYERKRKCRVMSTPFKARVEGYPSLGNKEFEFVLVRPDESAEIHQVLNDLEDTSKQQVQLNERYIAEVNYRTGTIQVGCQTISFSKVRELYEVIFAYRKPEPLIRNLADDERIDSLRREWDAHVNFRMQWPPIFKP